MPPPFFARYLPSATLLPYVECYWMLHVPAGQSVPVQRMPADGRIEIMFSFAGASRREATADDNHCNVSAASFVLGSRGQGYTVEHFDTPYYVAIRFKPGGLSAFTRLPMVEVADIYLPLDCVWTGVREIEEQLHHAFAASVQIAILEKALFDRLHPPDHLPRLLYAADQIERYGVAIPVLADQINLSQKHLERLFARHLGFRPSLYGRIARFQKALYLALRQPGLVLSHLAAEVGYYDQAHFAKDFKTFSGVAPSQFFAAAHEFVQIAAPPQVVEFLQDA